MNALLARLVSYNLAALEFQRPPFLALAPRLGLLFVHAIGFTVIAMLVRAPLWVVGAFFVCLLAAQFLPRVRDVLAPAMLAPFWLVYALVALRFVWLRVMDGEIGGYFDYTLPDPRVLLHFEFILGAAVVYAALILLALATGARGKTLAMAAVVGAGAAVGWAAVEYIGHRTFGATGSDPYAYVQMGVDLATRGTASHLFPLFPLIADSTISWFPVVHFGYHLPFDANGKAITVWSVGGALAYAVAYRIAGESALYVVNPIFSVLSVLVSGLLAWELTRRTSQAVRIVTASATMALVATSNEIVNWAGVTMVDTQALVFSVLAFYCALRVHRTGKWGWAIGAGLSWGMAYWVRHTQLVIVLGLLPLVLLGVFNRRTRVRNVILMGAAAFVVALPDLWYHQTYLGNWLTPESEELALFSLSAVSPTLGAIAQSALIGAEFGWLALFVIAGIVLFARRERVASIGLLLWLCAAFAVHLPYAALRLRDLIPEFPIVAFYATFGIVGLVAVLWERRSGGATIAAAIVIFAALELGLVRVWDTLPRVVQAPQPRFGTMTAAQRESFRTLGQLIPSNAIVGASLNSGAIELYSGRNAFRPTDWSAEELRTFLRVTQGRRDRVFLLEDNAEMARVVDDLKQDYRIERVTTLDVPLFGDEAIRAAGTLWQVETGE